MFPKFKNKILIACLFLRIAAIAQVFDSARLALNKDPGLDIVFGSRFSFFANQPAVIQSAGLGLNYDKKISFGLSYNWLTNNIQDERTFFNKNFERKDTAVFKLYFRYLSLYSALVYHKTKRWKFKIPINLGVGRDFYKNIETNSRTKKFTFLIYEPAVHVQYKIIRWFGVGANIGFRFIFQKEKFIANQFNSPTYAVGINISWDELAKDLFPNNRYIKKLGPKAW